MAALWAALSAALTRFRGWPRAPWVVLGLTAAFSTGARVWRLDDPHEPSGGLIFDEKYYVNAARVMLHLGVPCNGSTCDPYSTMAGGTDPNSEHPPLGKAMIALGMKIFGDNPWGWRIFPLIFGTLALFAIFWLVRSAGGGAWLATGAAALMAADNLFMVHGRIATLDIFVVVFMLAAVALYLRGHPLLSGITLGVGACTKLVAPDALLIIILIEGLRVVAHREWQGDGGWRVPARRLVPLMWCAFSAVLVYLSVLQVLDMAFSPFHDPADSCRGSGKTFNNSFIHTLFMECYASKITSPNGPSGIASYPWQWLLNEESINYYTRSITVSATGQPTATHPVVAFQGLMNPAIILLAIPALALCVGTMLRERDDVSVLVVAWFAGSYLPFVGAAWLQHRTSYLYYMVIVVPAVYIAVARMFSSRWLPRSVLAGYVVILGYEFWALYPFRTWT